MKNNENINNGWGYNPQIIILSTSCCTDFAIIPEHLCDKLSEIRLEFIKKVNEVYPYPYPQFGSTSLHFQCLGEDFIHHINRYYLNNSKAKAVFIRYRDKIRGCSIENLPFEHIYF